MRNILKFQILLLIIGISFVSCQKKDRFGIKTDNKIEVKFKRFDLDIINADTSDIKSEVQKLYIKYPDFMSVYVSEVIGEKPSDTIKVQKLLAGFIADTGFVEVNKKVRVVFSDVSGLENEISGAFSKIHFLFPQIKLPDIYFFRCIIVTIKDY